MNRQSRSVASLDVAALFRPDSAIMAASPALHQGPTPMQLLEARLAKAKLEAARAKQEELEVDPEQSCWEWHSTEEFDR